MDTFITEASGLTVWGCHRQAVLETRSRFYTLRREMMEALILDAEIREMPKVKDKDSDKYKLFKMGLELSEKIEGIEAIIRELSRFYAQADVLCDLLAMDSRPDEDLEQEFWVKKMQMSATKEVLGTGRVSGETMSNFMMFGKKGEDAFSSVITKMRINSEGLTEFLKTTRIPSFQNLIAKARAKILTELKALPGSKAILVRIATPDKQVVQLLSQEIQYEQDPSGSNT
jgi:hypothetical protein